MNEVVVIGAKDGLTAGLASALGRDPRVGECHTLHEVQALGALPGGGAARTLVYCARTGRAGLPDPEFSGGLFEACAGTEVGHLVLLSSAAINEPNGHHVGFVDEARVKPPRNGNRVPDAWSRLESDAQQRLGSSDTLLTILRPAALPVPGGRDYISRLLAGRLAVTVAGHDPSLQLLSLADLSRAIAAAIVSRRPGVFNVAPDGVIPLRKALRLSGRRRLPLPHWVQRVGRRALAPLTRVATLDELQYARYTWSVSDRQIRDELSFTPQDSSADAVRALARTNGAPSAGSSAPARPVDDEVFDAYGMDKSYIAAFGRTLFRFLHDYYWRIEVKGLEHVPREGPAVLAGMHRGWMPLDGVMTLHLLSRELGRYPRFLIHPSLLRFPYLFNFMNKLGGIIACQQNADWVLGNRHLLGLFPEGIQGAFTMYRDAYRLGRFGRDEFVKMALRHRAPIVPYVTVGSAEIFPIVGRIDWAWLKRFTEWPFFPITLNGPLVPLPSKWHTHFLEPLHVEERYPPEAAGDRKIVRAISQEVRVRMTEAMEAMLARRPSIFYGNVFDADGPAGKEDAA